MSRESKYIGIPAQAFTDIMKTVNQYRRFNINATGKGIEENNEKERRGGGNESSVEAEVRHLLLSTQAAQYARRHDSQYLQHTTGLPLPNSCLLATGLLFSPAPTTTPTLLLRNVPSRADCPNAHTGAKKDSPPSSFHSDAHTHTPLLSIPVR